MRKRILLAIGGAMVVMLTVLTFTSRAILVESYRTLESRYIRVDVQRVRAVLDAQVAALGTTLTDWATWTEMYRFAARPAVAFAEANFSESGMENLGVNAVIVLDAHGAPVYVRAFGAHAPPSLAEGLLAWLVDHPATVRFSTPTEGVQGIVTTADGMLLVAARPILQDQAAGPVGGTLVMARLLDGDAVGSLERMLLVAVRLYPLDGVPAADRGGMAGISDAEPIHLVRETGDRVIAYSVLKDVMDAPSVLVRLDAPSEITALGIRALRYFAISLLVIGIIFCAVVLLVLERTVLARLHRLGSRVLSIGTGGDPTRRVDISGRDQVAYLGAAINGMLDALARSTEQLRASERRNEAFLDAIPDVIFRVTRDGSILDARSPTKLPLLEAAENLVGRDAELILALYSFISPDHYDRSLAAVAAALDTARPQTLEFHVDVDAGRRHYEERFVASGDNEVIVLVREVTAQVLAEEAHRKEILLKEIHHRVKNNLQVISSLLALQASASGDPHTRQLLAESRDPVRSMGLIHEKLYQGDDERGLQFGPYVRDLAAHLRHSYVGNSAAVQVVVDMEDVSLDMDISVPCGLIITELLSNALKYAFPAGRAGTITLGMKTAADDMLVLSVKDDGVGFPASVDPHAPATFGLRIVNTLCGQLRGTLTLHRGSGTIVEIAFPRPRTSPSIPSPR